MANQRWERLRSSIYMVIGRKNPKRHQRAKHRSIRDFDHQSPSQETRSEAFSLLQPTYSSNTCSAAIIIRQNHSTVTLQLLRWNALAQGLSQSTGTQTRSIALSSGIHNV